MAVESAGQVCTSLQTDNHASTPPLSFLQAGCPSFRATNSVKALKAQRLRTFSSRLCLQLVEYRNLGGGAGIEDGLDVESEVSEGGVTDARLALDADAEARLGAALSETDQEHQDVVVRRTHSGRLHTSTTHKHQLHTATRGVVVRERRGMPFCDSEQLWLW